jgi:hypothetical protein
MEMNNEDLRKDNIEKAVFDALKAEPRFELPASFADNVMAMVEHKLALKEARRDRWWLVGGIASIMIALVYVFTTISFKPSVGVFTFFSGYSGLVVFGVFFVTALHLIDKFLLKHSKNRVDQ